MAIDLNKADIRTLAGCVVNGGMLVTEIPIARREAVEKEMPKVIAAREQAQKAAEARKRSAKDGK